jgi:thiamine-monophosphate kinase
MTISERQLIAKIRSQAKIDKDRLVYGIGDDCAVYNLSENSADCKYGIITTDALVESVHFDLSWHPAKFLGRKSLSVNLSDIAAMGGRPLFALLTIALPSDAGSDLMDDFMIGFNEVLAEHGVLLIGGDTVKSSVFMISVTVLGEVEKNQVVYRSGAKDGDLIWVSGVLGQAAAGLEICRRGIEISEIGTPLVKNHLNPTPRTGLGQLLAERKLATAMMDISDGVATDLAHICKESSVRAEIVSKLVPISNETKEAAVQLGCSAIDWALKGGEDYELLFTSSADHRDTLPELIKNKTGLSVSCIGAVKKGTGVYINTAASQHEISYEGYDHF